MFVGLIKTSLIPPKPETIFVGSAGSIGSGRVHENFVSISVLCGSYLNSVPEQMVSGVDEFVNIGKGITVIKKLSETSDSPQSFIPLTFRKPELSIAGKTISGEFVTPIFLS